MTWTARFTRPDGTLPEGNYTACQSCKHGQYDFVAGDRKINPCYVRAIGSQAGSMLTAVDVGADGHMAGGSADLKCSGFEPIVAETAAVAAEEGKG